MITKDIILGLTSTILIISMIISYKANKDEKENINK